MVRRSGRSRSRGRPDRYEEPIVSPKPKKVAKAAKDVKEAEAKGPEFSEGDAVMARWPGSSLFFKAKVTLVREADEEYDVEYENGTVYTIRAKDVYKADAKVLKKATGTRRSKSRGRGRSAGRSKAKAAVAAEVKSDDSAAEEATDSAAPAEAKPTPAPKTPKVAKVKAVATPTRVSSRIAAKAVTDAFSDDETEKVKLAPNPELPDARGRKKGWSVEWVSCLFFTLFCPAVLVSLHTLCKAGCKLAVPKISTAAADYFNWPAFYLTFIGGSVIGTLGYLPIGKIVNGQRMNGFASLLLCLSAIPAMIYFKVPLNIVRDNYFQIMASCIAFSFFDSALYYAMSFRAPKSQLNSKGNTGNPIVDFFHGRMTNPKYMGQEVKLSLFRFSMMTLALLNVVMVADSIIAAKGQANPTVILAAAFQVLYAMDALFFEEYYTFSHDYLNTGCGFSLVSAYLTFPFLPTIITNYLLSASPALPWYYLVLIGIMNAVGYVIFRCVERVMDNDANEMKIREAFLVQFSEKDSIESSLFYCEN